MIFKLVAAVFVVFLFQVDQISGHGYLYQPVARSSAWRKWPSMFKAYYSDMSLFCGGKWKQHGENGGKCGICGEDASLQPKLFEKGGSYYQNYVYAKYPVGGIIDASVKLTANHKGNFQFRVCNIDGWQGDATEECLDKTVLADLNGNKEIPIRTEDGTGMMNFKLQLPSDLSCTRCVFQWKYTAGNSWGNGDQEEFRGCSDIQVLPTNKREYDANVESENCASNGMGKSLDMIINSTAEYIEKLEDALNSQLATLDKLHQQKEKFEM